MNMDVTLIAKEAEAAAFEAADKFHKEVNGGRDRYPCGFAWVKVRPANKGNTKAGKDERRLLEKMGLRKDYTGTAYEKRNPSRYMCQNVDTLEAGARAYATVLNTHGINAFAESRLD
jgi:hypothetical protein